MANYVYYPPDLDKAVSPIYRAAWKHAAEVECRVCKLPIGYNNPVYLSTFGTVTHASCLELEVTGKIGEWEYRLSTEINKELRDDLEQKIDIAQRWLEGELTNDSINKLSIGGNLLDGNLIKIAGL